ncbi:MAG: AI-2E family transporter [archaeon]
MTQTRSWKFFGLALLILILAMSLVVIWRFLDVLLFGLALAYITFPVAKKLNKGKTEPRMRWLMASLTAVIIVMVPLILATVYGINYMLHWFINNMQHIQSGRFLSDLKIGLDAAGLSIVSERIASEVGKLLISFTNGIGANVLHPTWLIEIFLKFAIFFISAFYFVFEAPLVKKFLDTQIPKREKFIQELMMSFHKICYGLFVGHFFTSVIIALLFGAGYWAIFRPDMLFLGLLTIMMFIIAFLPLIGPWFMYVPLGLWHIMFLGDPTGGLVFLAFGAIVLTLIPDFYIRPKLVMIGSEIHPMLIILGFICGPLIMGMKGIVIGPLVLGLAQAILQLYVEKRHILRELIEHF